MNKESNPSSSSTTSSSGRSSDYSDSKSNLLEKIPSGTLRVDCKQEHPIILYLGTNDDGSFPKDRRISVVVYQP